MPNLPRQRRLCFQISASRSISTILTGVCLAAMTAALPLSVELFVADDIRAEFIPRLRFHVLIYGLYIFVFLSANTMMSVKPIWPSAALAVPAALLMSWTIIAGIFFGWFLLFSAPFSTIFSLFFASIEQFVPRSARSWLSLKLLLLIPVAVGCTLGLLVHLAAAILSGQPLWDRAGRKTALAHCL